MRRSCTCPPWRKLRRDTRTLRQAETNIYILRRCFYFYLNRFCSFLLWFFFDLITCFPGDFCFLFLLRKPVRQQLQYPGSCVSMFVLPRCFSIVCIKICAIFNMLFQNRCWLFSFASVV
jgi:hypothetical protein